jgi:hypothetical protein
MDECIKVETHREEEEFWNVEGELDEMEWYITDACPDSSSSTEAHVGSSPMRMD